MSGIHTSDQGAEGAETTEGVADATPAAEPEISNHDAKQLPWVRELMAKSAELDRLKKDQADAAARAEQERAEAEGRYNDALEMEKQARADEAARYEAELRKIKLETEFVKAGLIDPRAVRLFESDYDPDQMDATEFVSAIKADATNAMYFADPNQRNLHAPPKQVSGPPDTFDAERDLDSWLRSKDPKKRDRAIAYNRERYERQLRKNK